MTLRGHDDYCDAMVEQTDRLAAELAGADLSTAVPTCPGWTLDTLVRHIGGNMRAVETAVRTGDTVERPDQQVEEHAGPAGDDPGALLSWLTGSAARCAATLRAADPQSTAGVWAFQMPAVFWSRRALHDVVVHRADVAIARRTGYAVRPDLAADAVDELLTLLSGLQAAGAAPALAELSGAGRSIQVEATDEPAAAWRVEFSTDGFTVRPGRDDATVTMRGPLTDVLLTLCRRQDAGNGAVKVDGDTALLDDWLTRTAF